MEKSWITLFPDTFIWTIKRKGFVYNPNKLKGFRFVLNDKIAQLCKELLLPINLYSTVLTKRELEDIAVQKWILSITEECDAGYVTSNSRNKPVSFKPILKIQEDTDYYTWEHQKGFGGDIIQNLHELTFYINKSDNGSNSFYKQTMFPIRNCSQLNIKNIISFVRDSKNPFLSNVNLVGNIFLYPNYMRLIAEIVDLDVNCTIRIMIQDFNNHVQECRNMQFSDRIQFILLIDSSTQTNSWISLHDIEATISVTTLILSENEYNFYNEQFKNLPVYCDAQVIPIYKDHNLHLFENNVFMDQEDFINIKVTKREIFMHQTLNTNDFGKLTILADGSVYANVNMETLGSIEDSIYSMVYKEITEGQSWRRIRDTKPCCNCIYQWLCPSPSNYELVIGNPNLCHIKP